MDFDRFTLVFLVDSEDAPVLDDEASAALQDAHLAHLAQLHEDGHCIAAGPLLGGAEQPLRGLLLLRVDPDRARELAEADPAVRAGRYRLQILPWMVPAGAIVFTPTRVPRSMADVSAD